MPKDSKEPQPLISFDDDDEWQDMPVVHHADPHLVLDDEDIKKFHYVAPSKPAAGANVYGNATGNLIDFDDEGQEWRSKLEGDEGDYTRLRLDEDNELDEVHLRTKYLFDEDKAMTPLSQMQATKELLTGSQRIAYVGLCWLASREMVGLLKKMPSKEVQQPINSMELWALKIMGRLYHHMELDAAEQKMIESLAEHGVTAEDLAPSLITTHTVHNPDYDPAEAQRKKAMEEREEAPQTTTDDPVPDAPPVEPSPFADEFASYVTGPASSNPLSPTSGKFPSVDLHTPRPGDTLFSNTEPLLPTSAPELTTLEGVSTTLSTTDENVTLDIRWTVLCDLFLAVIADSVYDARSRVLLETVAVKLGLGWLDVVRFEKRVTDALEIEESAEKVESQEVLQDRRKKARNRRYVMMGLATLGGGLVLGLSAGLLAPVIGAGLGAAFATVGVTGTTAFLGGTAGAAMITTGGVLTGGGIGLKGMARRTGNVKTFEILPLHNNKRVNCIITVPGFMQSLQDDVRLPFSVLDPIVGDVFSVLWEPAMMQETGNALRILTTEVLTQVGQTVLQATVMTGLMSALTWPLVLTKLGYLIDNPWSNALDRASAAGLILADILRKRTLGVRPITLIGFSLGARVIFYALLELAKQRAFGIVQDVILLGATITASTKTWHSVRSVVAGRFVNAYARNDWVLNYLFRASVGGLYTVAGLRPIADVPGLENVDVTDKIAGHASYRIYMPIILHQIGFPVTAEYFDEPEDFEMEADMAQNQEKKKRFNFFSRRRKTEKDAPESSANPWSATKGVPAPLAPTTDADDDLPERVEHAAPVASTSTSDATDPSDPLPPAVPPKSATLPQSESTVSLPARAGFDFDAINQVLQDEGGPAESPLPPSGPIPPLEGKSFALSRSGSAPPLDTHRIDAAGPGVAASTLSKSHLAREEGDFTTSPSADLILPRFERSLSLAAPPPVDPSPFVTPPAIDEDEPAPAPTLPASKLTPYNYSYANGSNVWSRPKPVADLAGSEEVGLSFGTADGSISFVPSEPPSETGLSFGTADGSVTFSEPLERDPWAPPPPSKKFDSLANPWS